jgi:hypothetical protein
VIYAQPGATFAATMVAGQTGLTPGVAIEGADGTTHTARTTAGIVEVAPGSGVYSKDDLIAPDTLGNYLVLWDDGNGVYTADELRVSHSGVVGDIADETALARLRRMSASDTDPALTDEELNDILALSRIPDTEGRLPLDDDYEVRYDFNFAAAQAWDTKAGRCSDGFRFEEDTQVFYREQVFRHCQAMAKRYRRGAVLVPLVGSRS